VVLQIFLQVFPQAIPQDIFHQFNYQAHSNLLVSLHLPTINSPQFPFQTALPLLAEDHLTPIQ
jgi:hypothetical protein